MNMIQKAWLKVLKPVTILVNDKMAKRSGIIGRIGRFYSFGPRQFGFHPINRWFRFMNQLVVAYMGLAFHKTSVMKSLTMNGYNYMRASRLFALLGPLMFFYTFIYLSIPDNADQEEGTTLEHITNKLKIAPINALNDRISAHYTEINQMYGHEMLKKWINIEKQLVNQRKYLSDKTKKTKYAQKNYKYIQAHTNVR